MIDFLYWLFTIKTIETEVILAKPFLGWILISAVVGWGLSLLFRPRFKAPEEPKPGDLQVQTSTRGMPIPIVYGKRRLAGNLIWYGNFQVHRHYQTARRPGKGGRRGGREEQAFSHYTYSASFAFGICIGPATILRIWRGKDEIPPADWGRIRIRIYKGTSTQTPDPHLSHFVPRAPAYRHLCYIVWENCDLGMTTFLPQLSFEIRSRGDDLPPSDISQDILTNDLYGLGLPMARLNTAAFTETRNFCLGNDLLISMVIESSTSIVDVLQNILAHHNGFITWQGGRIAHRQIKTETITNFITVEGDVVRKDPPVSMERTGFREMRNRLRLRYTKRADAYTTGIVQADDEVHQAIFGMMDGDVNLPGYTVGARAMKFAWTLLRRSLVASESFAFSVGPRQVRNMFPGSVFALTDTQLGLTNIPMRVVSMKEGKDYKVDVEAIREIDYVLDLRDAPSAVPFIPPMRGGIPRSVIDKMLMEFPPLITHDGNILGLTFGQPEGGNWAGATVHQSFDNITYTNIRTLLGAGLIGTVNSVIGERIRVTITDGAVTLQGVADVFALLSSLDTNLCWVRETDKFFRFARATLISPRVWDIEGIIWDVYGTPSLIPEISVGQRIAFLRYLQEPISFPFGVERRGRDIFYKVVSFNFFGESEDISLVPAISRRFEAIGSRPIAPANLEIDGKGNITRIPPGDIPLRWRSINRRERGLNYTRSDQITEDIDFRQFDIIVRTGTTILRNVSVTGTTWTYTSAMRTADGNPTSIAFEIVKRGVHNFSFPSILNVTIV